MTETCLHRYATEAERAIATKLVEDILAAECIISVNDGEDVPLSRSADKDAILGALATTDQDVLIIRDPTTDARLGWVQLIWGNGTDLISDSSANEGVVALLTGAEALAEELAR